MYCHIVPISYLKRWTTEETLGFNRENLRTYVFQKDSINPQQESILMEKIESIKIKDFYILDIDNSDHLRFFGPELIEEFRKQDVFKFDVSYEYELISVLVEKKFPELNNWAEERIGTLAEQKDGSAVKRIETFLSKIEKRWGDFVKEANTFTLRGNMVRAAKKDELIEFVTIQLYRCPNFINPQIKANCEVVNRVIPDVFKSKNVNHNTTLLRMLYDYRFYKTNRKKFMKNRPCGVNSPIAKTVEQLKDFPCVFIVASYDSTFLTSDAPCYIIESPEPYSGVYLPISPKICLLLAKRKTISFDKYIIMDANKRIVNFINFLTVKNSTKEVFSYTNDIGDCVQRDFPLKDFRRMFNSSNMPF